MSEINVKRRAILVLGMHRSGTSAATRVVNLLGAHLGDRMLLPAADNESGFWEHADVVRIDNALLASLGREWHDLRPLPRGWMCSEAAQNARVGLIKTLEGQFPDNSLWAVKDPRMCLLLPLWLDVLRELEVQPCILLVVRHPKEVAQSLQVRDGLPLLQSFWLWLRYIVEAEYATRELPRAVVGYPSLLADWRGAMTSAAAAMGIDWPNHTDTAANAVDAFLDTSRRHHINASTDDADLPPLLREMYVALLDAENDRQAWAKVKQISDQYVQAERSFGFSLQAAYDAINETISANSAVDRQMVSSLAMSILDDVRNSPPPPKIRDIAKLYWQCGDQGFDEALTINIEHERVAAPIRFSFRLPDGVRPDSVRFDPSTLPGQFEIFGLRVNGYPIDDIGAQLLQVHQHRLPSSGLGHIRILALNDDPWVRFDLRNCQACGSGPIEIEIISRYEGVQNWMQNIIDSAVVNSMRSAVQTMTDAISKKLDEISLWHGRQTQVMTDLQKHIDTNMVEVRESLMDLSSRYAQHWMELHSVAAAMASHLDSTKEREEAISRMASEYQTSVETHAEAICQNVARNLEQLLQTEVAMQTQMNRLQESLDAVLERQSRSLWVKLSR